MIDPPEVTRSEGRLIARIALRVPRSEIREAMGPALRELISAVMEQGIGAGEPWFAHHLRIRPDHFDLEVCLAVTSPVSPVGRVEAGERLAERVARTIYRGGYEGLGEAWGEFRAWIAANGYEPCADVYECYLAGAETSADRGKWRTELSQPLRGGPTTRA